MSVFSGIAENLYKTHYLYFWSSQVGLVVHSITWKRVLDPQQRQSGFIAIPFRFVALIEGLFFQQT